MMYSTILENPYSKCVTFYSRGISIWRTYTCPLETNSYKNLENGAARYKNFVQGLQIPYVPQERTHHLPGWKSSSRVGPLFLQ
jgi:hypothetical protein